MSITETQIDTEALKSYFLGLQDRITKTFGELDGKAFITDEWQKPADSKLQGYGRTCILAGGHILEKGGVGFSHVHGKQTPPSATHHRPELTGREFEAMGLLWYFILTILMHQLPI